MKDRTYALVFLAVTLMILLIVCVGLFMLWNFVQITRTRTELVQRQATVVLPSASATAQTPVVFTPTPVSIPTPVPPTPTPTPRPQANPPTPTPTFTLVPSPTPTPTRPIYAFVPAGSVRPASEKGCIGGSIFGYVRDAKGSPLGGVRVKVFNPWGYQAVTTSKTGVDQGYYDIILSTEPSTWYVVVVDEKGKELSPRVMVEHKAGSTVCHYQVDWRRTY